MDVNAPMVMDGVVSAVAYDMSGTRMAIATRAGRITIHDGAKLVSTVDHGGEVDVPSRMLLTWAPPQFGGMIASCDGHGNVVIFEEQTGTAWRRVYSVTLSQSMSKIIQIQFAPSSCGLLMLGACCENGRVVMYGVDDDSGNWNLTHVVGGNHQQQIPTSSGCHFTWCDNSHDDPAIAIASNDDVSIWQQSSRRNEWMLICRFSNSASTTAGASNHAVITCIAWARNLGRSFHCIATASGEVIKIWKVCVIFPNNETSAILQVDNDGGSSTNSGSGKVNVTLMDHITLSHGMTVNKIEWNVMGTVLATSFSGTTNGVKLWHANLKGQFVELSSFMAAG